MPPPIIRLNPPSLPDAGRIGYSQISIIEPGRMAYVSGQVARRRDGARVPQDIVEQMAIVAQNVRAALREVGATPQHVVMARIYMVDLTPQRLADLMPPLLATFDGVQPCLTGVGVTALAEPELQIELELIVRLPD